jgi:hypothetical protein
MPQNRGRPLTPEEDKFLWDALFRSGEKLYDAEPADPRRDCPWKCRADDAGCICMRGRGQGGLKP